MSFRGQYEFQKGTVGTIAIETLNAPNGSRQNVDNDAIPTIVGMWINGAAVDPSTAAYAVSVVQEQNQTPAAITGLYALSFATSPFNRGDVVMFDVSATLDSTVINVLKEALIVDDPTARPAIS